MVARWQVALCVAAMALVSPMPAAAHPMHSTITEVTEDRAHGTIRAVIRVFSDDLDAVLAKRGGARLSRDQAMLAYVSGAFVLDDRSGRALTLHSCGSRGAAGVVFVCVETESPAGLAALTLRAAMLCDLYADQVNVVQATVGGVKRSFLFTRGAKAKPFGSGLARL